MSIYLLFIILINHNRLKYNYNRKYYLSPPNVSINAYHQKHSPNSSKNNKNKQNMDSSDFRDKSFSLAQGITKRQAQKALKNHLRQVDFMNKRIKVLTSQAEYNRYREKVQADIISRHQQIHEQIVAFKEAVNRVCRSRDRSQERKESNQKMNRQIKEKIAEASSKIKLDNIQQCKQLRLLSQRNSEFLASRKLKNLQDKREKRNNIQRLHGQIRESVSRYNTDKIEEIKAIKNFEKNSICLQSETAAIKLKQLSAQQQELIRLNSDSLHASRIKGQQIRRLIGGKMFGKSFHLPEISKSVDLNRAEDTH